MLRYGIFSTVSDTKISATQFTKYVGVVYMAPRQEIIFFRPAVVKFTQILVFSTLEHHLNLLPFLPLMLDPTSQCVYYLRRNQQRALQVARLRLQMVWNLCIVSIVWGDGFHIWSGNWTTLE